MYIWKYVYVIIIYVYEEKTNWYQKKYEKTNLWLCKDIYTNDVLCKRMFT